LLEQAVDDAITAANAEKEDVSIYDAASVGESSDGSFVDIYLSGKDNLTSNMVRKGMLMQAADILESLQSRDDIEARNAFSGLSRSWTLTETRPPKP